MKKFILLVPVFLLAGVAAYAVDFDVKACVSPHSEIFVSGLQRFVSMKNGPDNRAFSNRPDETRYSPTAVALGYQYSAQNWTAGLSASFETGDIRYVFYPDEFARIRDQTVGFTLFGTYQFGAGYYAKASAFLGFANQKLKDGFRTNSIYSSDGSVNSTRFGGSLEFGKEFDLANGLRITPHAGFDYAHIEGKGIPYLSNGASGYAAPWPSQSFYEIPVGVTFAKDFSVSRDWVLTPSLDATLVSAIGNINDRNMNGRPGFVSRTGSDWKVYGVGAGHWGARVEAGVTAFKAGRFDLNVKYGFEGRKRYQDHRIALGFGMAF